jgi:hypothetical protein
MQPQDIFFRPHLRDQLELLKREAEERSAKRQAATLSRLPVDSLQAEYVRKIQSWLSTLAPAQRMRAYTIDEVVALACLRGSYREGASVQLTGRAARQCGMVPKRDWSAAGRNQRFWQLPNINKEGAK